LLYPLPAQMLYISILLTLMYVNIIYG
jgi:hypothetical protein